MGFAVLWRAQEETRFPVNDYRGERYSLFRPPVKARTSLEFLETECRQVPSVLNGAFEGAVLSLFDSASKKLLRVSVVGSLLKMFLSKLNAL